MTRINNFLRRYKWWILAGSSVIVLSLISLLFLVIVLSENYFSNIETQVQIPSALPTTITKKIDSPTQSQELIDTPKPPTEEKIEEIQNMELAYVQKVIDGDSIEVILDGEVYELRYIGINAPESGKPFFNDATMANKRFVENQIVEIESDISDTDKYGRLLRYVYLQNGSLVNAELVGLGLAVSNAYPPDIKYQQVFESREKFAQDAGLGIWAPTVTPTVELDFEPEIIIQVDPSCSQFNAPGNDNNNKNEEYVCIANNGSKMVELLGWSLHDEFGWAYQFPVFNLEGNSFVRVFTGCGNDSSQELYWCKDETAVWNNDGDCVYLQNSEGIEKAKYCY
jgi:endonuclease YncB( thermonuclease family)